VTLILVLQMYFNNRLLQRFKTVTFIKKRKLISRVVVYRQRVNPFNVIESSTSRNLIGMAREKEEISKERPTFSKLSKPEKKIIKLRKLIFENNWVKIAFIL